jgi:chorismate dehydratase
VEPEYRDGGGDADASLVIGDPALKTRLNGHVVLDLAAEWRAFSGHPFVFAFWAVRDGVPEQQAAEIVRASYDAGRRDFPRLVSREAAESGLSEAVVEDYLRHSLHYELDAGDLAGLDLFYQMAAEENLIPAVRPIELA